MWAAACKCSAVVLKAAAVKAASKAVGAVSNKAANSRAAVKAIGVVSSKQLLSKVVKVIGAASSNLHLKVSPLMVSRISRRHHKASQQLRHQPITNHRWTSMTISRSKV